MLESIIECLRRIRERKPLIHNITNFVVMNETANAILCIGALPIMSHAAEEVQEMVGIANCLVLNIGTLSPDWIDAMIAAGKAANKKGIPIVLDPVGAGATRLRTESCRRLLSELRISSVRGNLAEVAALVGIASEVRGVESIAAADSPERVAQALAETYGCTAAVTGATDIVCDGSRLARISNGHPLLGKVVGTGCMSTAIVGAFAAVEPDPFTASAAALTAFGIAGELAATVSGDRPGTFHVELYNALYALSEDHVRSAAKIEIANVG
ncbi:MAG: hydroxyethylthiazole kinase [Armatimonadota bacterium]|nr:hydroxyethylthiazole kinase [Armatimonadota bacterium]